ncbi:MAG: asparaginase domain-containing protein [Bacteroidetes bacterium]|nr:asparaginase domain-containing protein [Bacteroidota bacterium]
MKILFIQTGGTIDKDYPKNKNGYAFEIGEPAVKRVLEKINPSFDYEIIHFLKKDSTEIIDEDRRKLLELCEGTPHSKIVVTHGTDTMIETAEFLSSVKNKTIVLTGAFKPERFKDSDADFNAGTAIGAVNALGAGVYISMNGITASFDKIHRDDSGMFIRRET